MKIINTADPAIKPSVVMLCYGEGGVGKTTFSATAPKPLLLDFENGSKYFGLRGIDMDVARIETWPDMRDPELLKAIQSDKYETIIIDPVGEAMEKLKKHMVTLRDSKLVQKDGSPTMAGWGWLKKTMREYIKWLRDLNKNVVIVAHIEEKTDEGRLVKRPKVETKLSDELVSMVDIVAYMTTQVVDGETKRLLLVDAESDKYTAKDRTGQLGNVIPPNFEEIVTACQGGKEYAWSKPKPVRKAKKTTKTTKTTKATKKPAKAKNEPNIEMDEDMQRIADEDAKNEALQEQFNNAKEK